MKNRATKWANEIFLRSMYGISMRHVGAREDKKLIDTLFRRIVDEYSVPSRYYHGLPHIVCGVRILHDLPFLAVDTQVAILAYIYHDIVCVPGAKENEERSAEWAARDLFALEVSLHLADKVRSTIMATKHTGGLKAQDDKIVADVDIVGLGAPWDEYPLNGNLIRREYLEHGYTLGALNAGRKKFLESMLARLRIYYLNYFYHKYEDRARENLARDLKELEGLGR